MTVEFIKMVNLGDQRLHAISFVAEAVRTEFNSELDYIEGLIVSPKSVTTSFYGAYANALSAATESNGTISITGLAAGDEFHILAFGR